MLAFLYEKPVESKLKSLDSELRSKVRTQIPNMSKKFKPSSRREFKKRKIAVHPTVAPHQVILLALFDLAEEYLQAKDRVELHQRKLDERASALVSLIETELK